MIKLSTARTSVSQRRCKVRRAAAGFVSGLILFALTTAGTRASDGIETAGDVLHYLLPAAAGGLTLGYQDGTGAIQFGESAAVTLGVTFGLKYTVHERRPNGDDLQSFPSGHSSISFCSAEFMRKRYGWEYGIPAYIAASFVAYSRVEAEKHFSHDVIAGAFIGIASSYIFTRPYKGWHAQIEAGEKYYGFRLTRAW
jgi:membrane-associated phospholipid phosphatase